MIDPYEVLDVAEDATDAAIKAAFKKAAFASHPDRGGSEEAFARVKLAYDILIDPERRSRFDEYGTVDGMGPDNTQSMAHERIANFFINSIEASIDRLNLDQLDLVQGGKTYFAQQIADNNLKIHQITKRLNQFDKALKRLKTSSQNDVIRKMLLNHVGRMELQIEAHKHDIKINEYAKEVLSTYTFERILQVASFTGRGINWIF